MYIITAAVSYILALLLQEYGVKGPAWLATVPEFDLIDGMSFDYMHCVLLGVTRLLLRLWFTPSFHGESWYLNSVVKEIDDRLCSIRPPDEIQRTPRSIEKTLKFWKGMSVCLHHFVE